MRRMKLSARVAQSGPVRKSSDSLLRGAQSKLTRNLGLASGRRAPPSARSHPSGPRGEARPEEHADGAAAPRQQRVVGRPHRRQEA
eukprot:889819-Pyramimonas_sp.AAC.1